MAVTDAQGKLDPALIQFVSDNQSMHVATASPHGRPSLVRGYGCAVSPDGGLVTVLVDRLQAQPLIRDIELTRKIAVVWSDPISHKTIQLKGSDARLSSPDPSLLALLPVYRQGFIRKLAHYDIPEHFCHALSFCDSEQLVAFSFSPGSAFEQSPGQNAGKAL